MSKGDKVLYTRIFEFRRYDPQTKSSKIVYEPRTIEVEVAEISAARVRVWVPTPCGKELRMVQPKLLKQKVTA